MWFHIIVVLMLLLIVAIASASLHFVMNSQQAVDRLDIGMMNSQQAVDRLDMNSQQAVDRLDIGMQQAVDRLDIGIVSVVAISLTENIGDILDGVDVKDGDMVAVTEGVYKKVDGEFKEMYGFSPGMIVRVIGGQKHSGKLFGVDSGKALVHLNPQQPPHAILSSVQVGNTLIRDGRITDVKAIEVGPNPVTNSNRVTIMADDVRQSYTIQLPSDPPPENSTLCFEHGTYKWLSLKEI